MGSMQMARAAVSVWENVRVDQYDPTLVSCALAGPRIFVTWIVGDVTSEFAVEMAEGGRECWIFEDYVSSMSMAVRRSAAVSRRDGLAMADIHETSIVIWNAIQRAHIILKYRTTSSYSYNRSLKSEYALEARHPCL